MRHRPSFREAVVVSTAVAVVATIGANTLDLPNVPDCLKSVFVDRDDSWKSTCTPDIDVSISSPLDPGPSQYTWGELAYLGDKLTGDAHVEVFGEATASIGGEPSWVGDDGDVNTRPGPDGTEHWNKDGDGVAYVISNLCVFTAEHMGEPISENPEEVPYVHMGDSEANVLYYQPIVAQTGAEKGDFEEVLIYASLQQCFTRLEQNHPNRPANNKNLYTFEGLAMRDGVKTTFETFQDDRIIMFAKWMMQPESLVGRDILEASLGRSVLGGAIADHPRARVAFEEAWDEGRFRFIWEDPMNREELERQVYMKHEADIRAVTRTIPDAQGYSYPMESKEFGDVADLGTELTTPFGSETAG